MLPAPSEWQVGFRAFDPWKGLLVIEYRHFRNEDPPGLAEVWNRLAATDLVVSASAMVIVGRSLLATSTSWRPS